MANGTNSENAAATRIFEPITEAFLAAAAAAGGPALESLSPDDARAVFVAMQSGPTAEPDGHIEDTVFPVGPTGSVDIRIVRPDASGVVLPAVMFFHGGGWILGDKETYRRLVHEIAQGANVAVVFVDYARAPEARYPVAIEQAYAAMRYVADHARALRIDATRIAVAGDSAGGNMTAAVTLLAKARGAPRIQSQVLICPVTDADFSRASYTAFADGPILTQAAMRWFWDSYVPDVTMRREASASPLRASTEELKGLPAALVITAEYDVLRDEGEDYAHRLTQAGVETVSTRYASTMHDFPMLNALARTATARAALAQANAFLKNTLA
jgi:acetyl esterase